MFYLRISGYSEAIYFVYHCQNIAKLNPENSHKFEIKKIKKLLWFTFSRQRRIWSFHVVVLHMSAKKCTKNYNARAQPLFCSFSSVTLPLPLPLPLPSWFRKPHNRRGQRLVKNDSQVHNYRDLYTTPMVLKTCSG